MKLKPWTWKKSLILILVIHFSFFFFVGVKDSIKKSLVTQSEWRIFTVSQKEDTGKAALPETTMYGEVSGISVNNLEECQRIGYDHVEKSFKERGCPDCFHESGFYCGFRCEWGGDPNEVSFGDGGFLTDYRCEKVFPGKPARFL